MTGDVNHPVTSDISVYCFKVEGRGKDAEGLNIEKDKLERQERNMDQRRKMIHV